jgi:DUF4097 and DUF4098 domain-containing protein YvlB
MAMRRRALPYLFVALVTMLLSACIFDGDGDGFNVSNTNYSAFESFSHSIPVQSRTRLSLSGINGSMDISGIPEATTVEIWGERRVSSESTADAELHLEQLNVQIREYADRIEVETDQPRQSYGRTYVVEYHCTVPDTWTVLTQQVNGGIAIDSLYSDVSVVSVNGNVSFGTIGGDVSVLLTNGDISMDGVEGDVDAALTNGRFLGWIVLPSQGLCRVNVTNGLIELSVPANTSAEVSAGVVNGSISVTDLVLANLVTTPTSLTGRLGAGDGQITLNNVNGNIVLIGF